MVAAGAAGNEQSAHTILAHVAERHRADGLVPLGCLGMASQRRPQRRVPMHPHTLQSGVLLERMKRDFFVGCVEKPTDNTRGSR